MNDFGNGKKPLKIKVAKMNLVVKIETFFIIAMKRKLKKGH
jgi:hypothetical protein